MLSGKACSVKRRFTEAPRRPRTRSNRRLRRTMMAAGKRSLDFCPNRGYISYKRVLTAQGCGSARRKLRCVAARATVVDRGGRWFLRMRGGCRKNVYFCFGEKGFYIKVLCGIHVYFCIPARKSGSSEIRDLAEKMSTFVYFCIPLMFGTGVFRSKSIA